MHSTEQLLVDVVPPHAESRAGPPVCGQRVPTSRSLLSILFVEDDDGDAYLIERILNANPRVGSVVRVRDGEDGLKLVSHGVVTPDIAIVDLQMPRMDGMTLMKRFQQLGVDFSYFVFSSSNSTADMLRAFQSGTSFFLTKADKPEELAVQVNMALQQF